MCTFYFLMLNFMSITDLPTCLYICIVRAHLNEVKRVYHLKWRVIDYFVGAGKLTQVL